MPPSRPSACQEVDILDCDLVTMAGSGIWVDLVAGFEYLEWQEEDGKGRNCLAYWPVTYDACPNEIHIRRCLFWHLGQESAHAAVSLVTCASNVEVEESMFLECVDGVTSDNSGSGLRIHHNLFLIGLEGLDKGGDGNGIDLKNVRPRTFERTSGLIPSSVPEGRWTWIHDNWFLGNVGAAVVLHKGTGWVHFFRNHVIDNVLGLVITPKALSMVPIHEIPGAYSAVSASEDVSAYPFSYWDEHGIYPGSRWRSPLDAFDVRDGVRVMKIRHIYVYRNVIAGNWMNGLLIEEGPLSIAGEKPSVTTGLRSCLGGVVEDLVITQNTVDSNGGVWIEQVETTGGAILRPYWNGLQLSRCSSSLEDGYGPAPDSSVLRDGFVDVAIYNNLFTNNYACQVAIFDETIDYNVLSNLIDTSAPYNVEPRRASSPRKEVVGIRSFVYYGLDYNVYGWRSDGGYSGMREVDYEVSGSGGSAHGTQLIANDVWIAAERGGVRDQFRLASDPFIYEHFGLEVNRTELDTTPPYELSGEYLLFMTFNFARWARTEYGDELYAYYLGSMVGESIWRPRPGPWLEGRGAPGAFFFPDRTHHAETDEPISESPDIEGNFVTGVPDVGAYVVGS